MRAIFTEEKKRDTLALLDKWFQRDDNSTPPTFILQPISSRLPNFNNPQFPSLQKEQRQEWWATFDHFQAAFKKASAKCVARGTMTTEVARRFVISVTNDEVDNGIINTPPELRGDKCFCFVRIFSDIGEHLDDPEAKNFIDLPWGQTKPDQDAQALLAVLRDVEVPKALPAENIFRAEITWSPKGVSPETLPEHRAYLDKFTDQFYTTMIELIDRGVKREQEALGELKADPLLGETLQHLSYCKSLADSFQGREDLLASVSQYLSSSAEEGRVPLVIHGESGCGKTSVMAKAFSQARTTPNTTAILRFLGTTADSSSVLKLLTSLTQQILRAYSQLTLIPEIPTDFQKLVAYFAEKLALATAEQPLVVFLDSVDQLSSHHNAHRMTWLPKTLPLHVSLVVSTLPTEPFCLDSLRALLPKEPQHFVEVKPLPLSVSIQMIDTWLAQEKRTVTPAQRAIISKAAELCPLPLYLRLVLHEALRWKSYTQVEALPPTVPGLINGFFSRIEKQHGKVLVSHALGLITASKGGLSGAEIEDLLSLNDKVLQDVYQYWLPPVRRLPSILWARIRGDLGAYLMEREAAGSSVLYWYHRQFIQVARERYLTAKASPTSQPSISRFSAEEVTQGSLSETGVFLHELIADYFLGTWAEGAKKPFQFTEKQRVAFDLISLDGAEDRKVLRQPLSYGDLYSDSPSLNLRKLALLPYHLALAGRLVDLKRQALCNLDLLYAKIRAGQLVDLQSDLTFALQIWPEDEELKGIRQALRLCATDLVTNPSSLPFELAGRLALYAGSSSSHPALAGLYAKSCERSRLSLPVVPEFQSFPGPGGVLQASMSGHFSPILGVALTADNKFAISTSNDFTVKVWDLDSATLVLSIRLKWFSDAFVAPNSKVFVTSPHSSSPTCVHSFLTGELLHTLQGNSSKCPAMITSDSKFFISAPLSVPNGCQIWALETGEALGTLVGHSGPITSLIRTSLPTVVITGSEDGTLRRWNIINQLCLTVISPSPTAPLTGGVWFSPDEKSLLVVSNSINLLVLDASTFAQKMSFAVPDYWRAIKVVRFTKNFEFLALGTNDGYCRILKTASGEIIRDFEPPMFKTDALLELFQDQFLVVGIKGQDPPEVVDIRTGATLGALDTSCSHMARFDDQKRVLISTSDKSIRLLDLSSIFSGKLHFSLLLSYFPFSPIFFDQRRLKRCQARAIRLQGIQLPKHRVLWLQPEPRRPFHRRFQQLRFPLERAHGRLDLEDNHPR